MDVMFSGIVIEVRPVHPLNAWLAMEVSPVKYDISSNDVIWVLFWNTVPISVTAAASSSLSSPSPLVSQFSTQRALTAASAKMMLLAGGTLPATILYV